MKVTDSLAVKMAGLCFVVSMILLSRSQNSGCYLKAPFRLLVRMKLYFEGVLSKGQWQEQELQEPCLQMNKSNMFLSLQLVQTVLVDSSFGLICCDMGPGSCSAKDNQTYLSLAPLSVSLLSCGDLIGH